MRADSIDRLAASSLCIPASPALKTSHYLKLIQPKAPIPVNKALVAGQARVADKCRSRNAITPA
jgi:hypothetical protein